MRRLSRTAVLALAAWPGVVAADELPRGRQSELRYLLAQECGSCHGLTRRGGLGSPLLPAAMDGKSDESLIHVILNGMPGTPMPPWRDELSREDARFIVRLLRRGGEP